MAHSDGKHRSIGFDLSIESDGDIPGTLPDPASEGAPDLRIATLPAAEPPAPLYTWEHDTLTFAAPGVARYVCRQDSIGVAAAPAADPDMVTALLIATALPAVLWLRGATILHAAGIVAPSGAALAIAGPSGVGKSALAAELLRVGGVLLADDSIALRRRDGQVTGTGLAGGYHVGGDSRTYRPLPPERSIRAAPLDAVMILARTDGAPSLTRLSPVAALERLLANRHRPAVPAILGRRAETLATMAFIARHCAVYEWHRPGVPLDGSERDALAREGLW